MQSQRRLNMIAELFNITNIKIELYSMMLKDIATDELVNFYSFVLDKKAQYESLEVCTKRCVKEYKAIQLLTKIYQNVYRFSDIDVMIGFIKHNFKGKDLGYGLEPFLDFVIIAVDEEGNLRNKYRLNEFNKPSVLNCDEEAMVYNFLFKNQERIGVIKYISEKDTPRQKALEIDYKKMNELAINNKILSIAKVKKFWCFLSFT